MLISWYKKMIEECKKRGIRSVLTEVMQINQQKYQRHIYNVTVETDAYKNMADDYIEEGDYDEYNV